MCWAHFFGVFYSKAMLGVLVYVRKCAVEPICRADERDRTGEAF